MYRTYVQKFWKEDKTPMIKPGLGKSMPKEETKRQQLTSSQRRFNRLDLPTDTLSILRQYTNKAYTLRQYKTSIY